MGSLLLASFPGASSITTGGSCWRSKQFAKNYYPSGGCLRSKRYAKNCYASSYITNLWHKSGKIQKEYCAVMSPQHNLKQHYRVTKEGSTSQGSDRKYVVNVISEQPFEYESQPGDPKDIWDSIKDGFNVFYKFTRPYATFGAVMGATSVSFLAVEKLSELSPVFFIGTLQAAIVAFSKIVFICGLNQLCDVEIDKINKSYLPLASGEWSFRTGVIITASSLILGLVFAWIIGSWPLFWTLCITALLAVANDVNLPLLRWKKYRVVGTANNTISMGVVSPIGYFLHMQTYVFKRPATFPRQLIFNIAIITLFSFVLNLCKDLPDVEGDKKFGIQSYAISLGQKRAFWMCISFFQMIYGVAIVVGATSPFLWSKTFMVLGHSILASVLWYKAKSVDLKSEAALQAFYMFIWKLFYAEYFLVPFFR